MIKLKVMKIVPESNKSIISITKNNCPFTTFNLMKKTRHTLLSHFVSTSTFYYTKSCIELQNVIFLFTNWANQSNPLKPHFHLQRLPFCYAFSPYLLKIRSFSGQQPTAYTLL